MATPTADLDWDHSVGENLITGPMDDFEDDDDFDTLTFYNGPLLMDSTTEEQDSVKLSRRHLSFLLRSLAEAGSLLREQHNLQTAAHTRQPRQPAPERSRCRQSCDKAVQILTKFNLLVSIALQAIMLIVVTILDDVENNAKNQTSPMTKSQSSATTWPAYLVMILITFLNLCLVIYISVQLTKTMLQSRISGLMLGQAYLSTVIMFAGLYVITYRMNKRGWTLHSFNKDKDDDDSFIDISYLFLQMLHNSISTSTLCGASTVHPNIWYNFILESVQMLLSFLYFTSILRVAIGAPPRKRRRANTRLPRNPSMASLNSTEHLRLLNGNAPSTRYGGL